MEVFYHGGLSMLQGSIQPLAESGVTDRPRRNRTQEASEQERQARRAQGLCRDCDRRTKNNTLWCTWCRKRVELATDRYVGRPRKGRMTIEEMDKADATQAMRSLCAAVAGIDAVDRHPNLNRLERKRHKAEPLAQFGLTVRWIVAIHRRNGTLDELMESIEASLEDE